MPRGRPKGSKSTQAEKSRTSTTKINPDAKPGKIAAVEERTGFDCVCCGKHYKLQKSNFPHTLSPLYTANNGYLPICKNCIDKYYSQLVEFFSGNEEKAIDRVAQIADWYYLDDIWASTRKISADRSRVGAYPSKMQLRKDRGTTYLDTVRDRASVVVDSYESLEEMRDQGSSTITKAQFARWGPGFEEAEYKQLDNHYRSLCEKIDTNDVIQDNLAKDLCEIKIQQIRARSKGDADMYQKFTKLYQDTLKSANLKVNTGETNAMTDDELCWGNFIRDVEKFSPADIYMDKKLFSDPDGIRDYLERFVLRPVRNFFMGTREMDAEFSIGVGDDEDN